MRPKRSISRGIYLAILLGLLVLGVRAVFFHAFVPETSGIVDGGATRLSSENPGRVTDIQVTAGQRVEAGQVLVRLALANQARDEALAEARIRRLRAQVEGEQKRAEARAREMASRESARAADLRDKALSSSATVASLAAELTSARQQLRDVEKDLQKFDKMGKKKIIAETSYLDLRLRRAEIAGRIKSIEGETHWLEQKADSGMSESDRLLQRAERADAEALAASNVAWLEAQLAEARAELDMLHKMARSEILAPSAGTVSWIHTRKGEFAQAGDVLIDFVPDEEARVIGWPEDGVESFPVDSQVSVTGPGFAAEGHVESWFVQDRPKPGALLLPYQRETVSPAIAIRIDHVLSGVLRSGASVQVSRPVF